MKSIEIAERAKLELELIFDLTNNRWGQQQVAVVKQQFQAALETLAQFPDLSRETSKSGIRVKMISGLPFVILFRQNEDTIIITQILHTNRNRSF